MLVEGTGSLATARGAGGCELLVVGAGNYGHLHRPRWSSSFCLEEDAKDQVQSSVRRRPVLSSVSASLFSSVVEACVFCSSSVP